MYKSYPVTCPQCGASVRIREDRKTIFCSYCGTQLAFDDGSKTVTIRTVDEARIREAEIEQERERWEREAEERRRPGRIKATIVLAIVGGVMIMVGSNGHWGMMSLLGFLAIAAIAFVWPSDLQGR